MANYTTHEVAQKMDIPYPKLMKRLAAAKRKGYVFRMREDIYVLSEEEVKMLVGDRRIGRPKKVIE